MENFAGSNAAALDLEAKWLHEIFFARIFNHSRNGVETTRLVYSKTPPVHESELSPFVQFINAHSLGFEDRLLLDLALLPHINPGLIDHFLYLPTNSAPASIHAQLGTRGKGFAGAMPTGLTWLFLLAGNNVSERIGLQAHLSGDHLYRRENVLFFEPHYKGEPSYSGRIIISPQFLQLFTTGSPFPLIGAQPQPSIV